MLLAGKVWFSMVQLSLALDRHNYTKLHTFPSTFQYLSGEFVPPMPRHCGETCEIHTLGLGSGVSTALLQQLAAKGHGTANFLADGEGVTTCDMSCEANKKAW